MSLTLDWNKAHEILFGYPLGQKEPPELKVVNKAVDGFVDDLLSLGNTVVRQVAIEADKAGLPTETLPYFFFLLDKQAANWPQMSSDDRRGLNLAVAILKESGKMPPYTGVMALPDSQHERAADAALKSLGRWGASKFLANVVGAYQRVLERFERDLRKARPDVPRGSEDAYLNAFIRAALKKRPFSFTHGQLAQQAIEMIFE